MALVKPITEYAFFSDFDGTITQRDGTVELIKWYGTEEVRRDEDRFIAGQASHRDIMAAHYRRMRLAPKAYFDVLLSIPMDECFPAFYRALRQAGGALTVLTGSAGESVQRYLDTKGLNGIEVHGNQLICQDGIVLLEEADAVESTLCKLGPCPHCKSKWLQAARALGKEVVYIGDGLTDRCAAAYAHHLFAKATLAEYCSREGIDYIPFHTFDDITRYCFES